VTAGPAQPFAYVTNYRSDTVSVIDTASNTVTATIPDIPIGDHPGGGEPLHGHGHQGTEEETAFVSTPATTVLARLLPDATALRLDACHVDTTAAQIAAIAAQVGCSRRTSSGICRCRRGPYGSTDATTAGAC
jgi:YVTN family beta-propeller protein